MARTVFKLPTSDGLIQGAKSTFDQAVSRVEGTVSAAQDVIGKAVFGKVDSKIGLSAVQTIAGKVGLDTGFGNDASASWGNLSRFLIARLFVCDKNGLEDVSEGEVLAPVTECSMEMTLNWQSPFENAGPESKAPQLMAMIQSGSIGTVINSIQSLAPGEHTIFSGIADTARERAASLEGRTGITKLNSQQVFSGMPPMRIPMTLHFRALSDSQSEVMEPYKRLLRWALPQNLADNGVINQVISSATSSTGVIDALFPSEAPRLVGVTYGNGRYAPMVIEAVQHPLDGPMDSNGVPIYRSVQITLASLTALDKRDVAKLFIR